VGSKKCNYMKHLHVKQEWQRRYDRVCEMGASGSMPPGSHSVTLVRSVLLVYSSGCMHRGYMLMLCVRIFGFGCSIVIISRLPMF
jgi:hypothetical protein